MKKNFKLFLLIIISSASFISGCKKDAKAVIDCFGESLLVSVKATHQPGIIP